MFVDIRPPVRIACDLGLEAVDIPELGRGCVRVEQVVEADRKNPVPREGVMNVQVDLPVSLAVDLSRRGWAALTRN